jgi:hypothetical protein
MVHSVQQDQALVSFPPSPRPTEGLGPPPPFGVRLSYLPCENFISIVEGVRN